MLNILMLGPARNSNGGMQSLVNVFLDSNPGKANNITYIATYVDACKPRKLAKAIAALFIFMYQIVFKKIDIVHVHVADHASVYRKSVFVFLSRIFNKKIIIHVHGPEFHVFYHEQIGSLRRRWVKNFLLTGNRIVVLSPQWKKEIEKITGRARDICVIPGFIAAPAIKGKIKNDKCIRVLMMGRLGGRKGVYDLIEAAQEVIACEPKVKFILAGDGEVQKVRDVVSQKGMNRNFDIPGWIKDKELYFREADIYVLPSYNEGFPVSVLEAASYGLPVVTTNVGGIPEIIQDGVNGLLVNPGDLKNLKKKLLDLIASADLRKVLGDKARESVLKNYEVSNAGVKINELYEELMQ